ncbi:MAG: filamentous hemagglutinin N-terminal domain-containing protein [Candidatus Omnitrophica bacterium]|nr:filamentous hemagglutinin N-terminal domain-containing protein [Candidatus Omnitrophota bacterium]
MKLKRYTKLVAFRISPEMKEMMDEMAFKMHLTEGELIRDALDKYLEMRVKGLKKKRQKMKNKFLHHLLCLLLSLFLVLGPEVKLFALPQGQTVVSGSASFSQPDVNTLNIQTSDKVILEYNSFNIDVGEVVNFLQPSSSSVALNRVVGIDPSSIFGTLTANGNIFLINPNGILFGATANINVHGLVASTLDITNEDFLAGNYKFLQDPAKDLSSVTNLGVLTAAEGGYVVLAAPQVENKGVIQANLGTIALGSTQGFTISLSGDELISFAVDEAVSQELAAYLNNSGTLKADSGTILLEAKVAEDIVNAVVNNDGLIEANTLVQDKEGNIKLTTNTSFTNSGTLRANAADYTKAGNIEVRAGKTLTLAPTSRIEAKGKDVASEGGKVYLYAEGNAVAKAGQTIDISGGTISGDAGSAELSASGNVELGGNFLGITQEGYERGNIIIDPVDNLDIYSVINTGGANLTLDYTGYIRHHYDADLGWDGSIYTHGGDFTGNAGTNYIIDSEAVIDVRNDSGDSTATLIIAATGDITTSGNLYSDNGFIYIGQPTVAIPQHVYFNGGEVLSGHVDTDGGGIWAYAYGKIEINGASLETYGANKATYGVDAGDIYLIPNYGGDLSSGGNLYMKSGAIRTYGSTLDPDIPNQLEDPTYHDDPGEPEHDSSELGPRIYLGDTVSGYPVDIEFEGGVIESYGASASIYADAWQDIHFYGTDFNIKGKIINSDPYEPILSPGSFVSGGSMLFEAGRDILINDVADADGQISDFFNRSGEIRFYVNTDDDAFGDLVINNGTITTGITGQPVWQNGGGPVWLGFPEGAPETKFGTPQNISLKGGEIITGLENYGDIRIYAYDDIKLEGINLTTQRGALASIQILPNYDNDSSGILSMSAGELLTKGYSAPIYLGEADYKMNDAHPVDIKLSGGTIETCRGGSLRSNIYGYAQQDIILENITLQSRSASWLGANIELTAGKDIVHKAGTIIITYGGVVVVDDPGTGSPPPSEGSYESITGNIIENAGSAITIADGVIFDTSAPDGSLAGLVDLHAGSYIAITDIISQNVYLTSSGYIYGNGPGIDIKATNLAISSANGVASGELLDSALETEVSNLAVSNSAADKIWIANTGDLTIANLPEIIQYYEFADLDHDGDTDPIPHAFGMAVTGITNSGSGLTRITAASDINVQAPIISGGGDVMLEAIGGHIQHWYNIEPNQTGAVATLGGSFTANAGTYYTIDDGVLLDAAGGTIDLHALNDLTITGLRTVGGTVHLASDAGAVVDAGDTNSDVTATNLDISVATGVDTGDWLDTQVSNLATENSTSGDIGIRNTGDLNIVVLNGITGVNNLGSGLINIFAASDLNVKAPIISRGDITLISPGSISQTSSGRISTGGGDFFANVVNDYIMSAGSSIKTSTGNVNITAGNVATITRIDTSGSLGGSVYIEASQILDAADSYGLVGGPNYFDIWVGTRESDVIVSKVTLVSSGTPTGWPQGKTYRGATWPGIGDSGPYAALEIFLEEVEMSITKIKPDVFDDDTAIDEKKYRQRKACLAVRPASRIH